MLDNEGKIKVIENHIKTASIKQTSKNPTSKQLSYIKTLKGRVKKRLNKFNKDDPHDSKMPKEQIEYLVKYSPENLGEASKLISLLLATQSYWNDRGLLQMELLTFLICPECDSYYVFSKYCGCYVCNKCGDHKDRARCYCGWRKVRGKTRHDEMVDKIIEDDIGDARFTSDGWHDDY